MLDMCVVVVVWWAGGDPFAFGSSSSSGFIGTGGYFEDPPLTASLYLEGTGNASAAASESYGASAWFFQLTFCVNAVTIVSGAVAERIRIESYLAYSIFMTALVYPPVAHWAWSSAGWASVGPDGVFGTGAIDFAGSGVVHMTGGIMAGVGSYFLGPRKGRYSAQGYALDMAGQSTTFKAFGTVLLWFGWLAFNAGSATATQASSSSARLGAVASRAAVSTMLAAASGGVTCVVASMLASSKVERALRLDYACNGILAGLVSITSSCAVVSSWAAFVIGIVGALVYLWFSRL